MEIKDNQYGFDWGCAKFQRCCSDDKKGWTVTAIETPKTKLQIYITKTGKIRIHDDNHNEYHLNPKK